MGTFFRFEKITASERATRAKARLGWGLALPQEESASRLQSATPFFY